MPRAAVEAEDEDEEAAPEADEVPTVSDTESDEEDAS